MTSPPQQIRSSYTVRKGMLSAHSKLNITEDIQCVLSGHTGCAIRLCLFKQNFTKVMRDFDTRDGSRRLTWRPTGATP